MNVKVKICGITDETALQAAMEAGADFIGLVFFPPSPRHLELEQAARLAEAARRRVSIVALTVDAENDLLRAMARQVRPDFIQLHGQETPARAVRVAQMTGARIIKAFRIRTAQDLQTAQAYEGKIAFPLFDAWVDDKTAAGLPGGTGHSFDWSLLDGHGAPFMLAGGLNPENVKRAIRTTHAPMVDVSSGVENAPGIKDGEKIRQFIKAAKGQAGGEWRR